MIFPTSLSEYFKMSTQTPVLGLTAPAKYAITAAGGAVAGALILGGAKQYLEQKQTGSSEATQQFYITPEKGATVNIIDPTATATTEQKQKAEQTTTDYMGLLITAGVIVGAIILISKKWGK